MLLKTRIIQVSLASKCAVAIFSNTVNVSMTFPMAVVPNICFVLIKLCFALTFAMAFFFENTTMYNFLKIHMYNHPSLSDGHDGIPFPFQG